MSSAEIHGSIVLNYLAKTGDLQYYLVPDYIEWMKIARSHVQYSVFVLMHKTVYAADKIVSDMWKERYDPIGLANEREEDRNERKVVIVKYNQTDAYKIPKGVDLEDKTVVENYGVKWGTLHIDYVDGREETVESEGWDTDMKYPDEVRIENAKDWGINYDDDEEDADE